MCMIDLLNSLRDASFYTVNETKQTLKCQVKTNSLNTGSGILVTSCNGNTDEVWKKDSLPLYNVCARTVHLSRAILLSEISLLCQFSRWHVHHHHHISVMELGHLLTRSGLTCPEVSSKVWHNSSCQLGNRISLPWVIHYEAFYLYVIPSFSFIPVICPELVFTNLSNSFVDTFVRPSVCSSVYMNKYLLGCRSIILKNSLHVNACN